MEGKFQMKDMKGLTPALDPTLSESIFALSGDNYVFDSLGVKSPFGNRFLTPARLSKPEHVQGVRFRLRGGDRCFTFHGYGIVEWNEDDGSWRYLYVTADTTTSPYRWTCEYLNGYIYFAHPMVGLLVLNLDTDRCDPHEIVGTGTPEQIVSVTQNNGRLAVMTPTVLAWSAPSDGLNFTPTFGGAGFQVIAERVAGEPVNVLGYSRGILTWTTGGIMRSEFTGDTAVYRHRTLNIEYRPINSFCTARVDEDTVIFLDERGLFQSRGERVEPYAPIFNEFLLDFLQEHNYRDGFNVRIEWDDLQRRLYVSYSDSYASPLYEHCFVYYPPLDKWGEFNEPHYGILPLKITDSQRADDYFGFVDSEGCVRYWLGTGSREKPTVDSETAEIGNLYLPAIQKPSQFALEDTGMMLPCCARVSTFSRAGITYPEAYYASDVLVPAVAEVIGLAATIRFGLIRLTGPSNADEMSEITSVIIRSVKSGDSDVLAVDFNLVPDGASDEDFNAASGAEDLGLLPMNYVNHTFRLIGTVDGESEFMSVEPEMVQFHKSARFFVCSVVGIWHIAEIGAAEVGETFHLKTFELNGTSAGRYL